MYCEKCGQKIENSVICPKCGCLSGYKEAIKRKQFIKGMDLPVKIISVVGILFLMLDFYNLLYWLNNGMLNILRYGDNYSLYYYHCMLLVVVGAGAFVSLLVGKFTKMRILYPILNILSLLYSNIIFLNNYISFWRIFLDTICLISLILVTIYMLKKNKIIGLLSIIIQASWFVFIVVCAFFGYYAVLGYYTAFILIFDNFPILMFTIAIFLDISKKKRSSSLNNIC